MAASSATIRRPQLIDALKQRAGITVRHVAIIDLTNVGALVDGIGGIRVNNPAAFDVAVSGGQTWSFAKGPLQLDGAHAVAYLRRGFLTGNRAWAGGGDGAEGNRASGARAVQRGISTDHQGRTSRPPPTSRMRMWLGWSISVSMVAPAWNAAYRHGRS